jgi:hypothetical protein
VKRRTIVGAIAMLMVATPVFPCGGPGAEIVDRPIVRVPEYLSRLLHDDEYESTLRQELRFLEPFNLAMPDSVAAVYEWTYSTGIGQYAFGEPSDSALRANEVELMAPAIQALTRGAFAAAAAAARRSVNAVLDLPAGIAQEYRDALRTANELADIAPRLTSIDQAEAVRYFAADAAERAALARANSLTPILREAFEVRSLDRSAAGDYADSHANSPRAGSLRFVAIQQAMRRGIPDGYATQIKDSVPPAKWAELERLHEDWLSRYASHPMADYVRLSRVRLYYFKGDNARAWNELLAMYPRHRQRVLGEMRYLLYNSVEPPSLDDSRIDWPLRAALLMEVTPTREQWTSYWRASEVNRSEKWAVPLQERLLWRAAEFAEDGGELPAGFPTRAEAPTQLWAALRLLALIDANDIAAAFAQADLTTDLVDVPALRSRLYLLRREWGRAIAALGAGDPSTKYLISVLAPKTVVDSLANTRSELANTARLTVAARYASAGDWRAAARAASPVDTSHARRWAHTATLASDTSRAGTLAFARWMRAQRGQLFFDETTEWLRGLNWRRNRLPRETDPRDAEGPRFDTRLPWTAAQEISAIEVHLRTSTELYYALRAYARWLDRANANTAGLAAVVREANVVYNRLYNWDETNSPFWSETLESSAEAKSIRRAGALLNRR